jgi:hypothetical protein
MLAGSQANIESASANCHRKPFAGLSKFQPMSGRRIQAAPDQGRLPKDKGAGLLLLIWLAAVLDMQW